ncbi:MAG: ribulose-phosphate 3-epimerase [Selenomonadaceae bacterium]|nr:ribulose-phosphate 3-epimerase [Selenomonadaceae bacterium]
MADSKRQVKIAPSILSADFASLGQDVKKVDDGGAEYIHIDVMDGSFVPNITIGSDVVKSLRKVTDKVFDVHLMVNHPETQIESFAAAGADIITFHIEAAVHAHRIVQAIHALGKKAGVSLNPATPLSAVEELINDVDLILIMTVNPGYGGQKFIPSMVDKVKRLREMIDAKGSNAEIEIDGGIKPDTAKLVVSAGADVLVAGSYIYGADDIPAAIESLR